MEAHDLPLRTMLYLSVLPSDLEAAGQALAGHPEVREASLIANPGCYVTAVSLAQAAIGRRRSPDPGAIRPMQGRVQHERLSIRCPHDTAHAEGSADANG